MPMRDDEMELDDGELEDVELAAAACSPSGESMRPRSLTPMVPPALRAGERAPAAAKLFPTAMAAAVDMVTTPALRRQRRPPPTRPVCATVRLLRRPWRRRRGARAALPAGCRYLPRAAVACGGAAAAASGRRRTPRRRPPWHRLRLRPARLRRRASARRHSGAPGRRQAAACCRLLAARRPLRRACAASTSCSSRSTKADDDDYLQTLPFTSRPSAKKRSSSPKSLQIPSGALLDLRLRLRPPRDGAGQELQRQTGRSVAAAAHPRRRRRPPRWRERQLHPRRHARDDVRKTSSTAPTAHVHVVRLFRRRHQPQGQPPTWRPRSSRAASCSSTSSTATTSFTTCCAFVGRAMAAWCSKRSTSTTSAHASRCSVRSIF